MTGKTVAPILAAALIAFGLHSEPARAATGEGTVIGLVPGEYLYSCPLDPTPDCGLVVEG